MESDELQYSDAVIEAVDADRMVEAIKRLRAETGVGLREAKAEIDRLRQERQGARHPGKVQPITAEEGGAGGLAKLIVVIALLVAAYLYFF